MRLFLVSALALDGQFGGHDCTIVVELAVVWSRGARRVVVFKKYQSSLRGRTRQPETRNSGASVRDQNCAAHRAQKYRPAWR